MCGEKIYDARVVEQYLCVCPLLNLLSSASFEVYKMLIRGGTVKTLESPNLALKACHALQQKQYYYSSSSERAQSEPVLHEFSQSASTLQYLLVA